MIQLLADQNFDERILRGLVARTAEVDVVRVRDIGLSEADDAEVLVRAAALHRVIVTHDVNTLVGFAYARVRSGEPMAGVIPVLRSCPVGRAVEDLLLIVECTSQEEWPGQVLYLPL